jgi:hypothetical protein
MTSAFDIGLEKTPFGRNRMTHVIIATTMREERLSKFFCYIASTTVTLPVRETEERLERRHCAQSRRN